MKRKKAKKKSWGCDCDEINKNFKRYVEEPAWDDSGFILPDGGFVVLPSGKSGGKSEDDYTHDDLIGLFDDDCYVNDYIIECGGLRVRMRKNFWQDNQHFADKNQIIVVTRDKPTREQLKTLTDYFDRNRHGAVWLSKDDPVSDCDIITETHMRASKMDFQRWISRCW